MRRIREAIRLVHEQGMSRTRAAAALGIGKTTLLEILERLERSGLSPSDAMSFSDIDLETHLYPPAPAPTERIAIEPDVDHLVSELKRPGVTRKLLWEEYRKVHPQGLGYTAFCDRIQHHRSSSDLVMRQEHKPGEKVFVDYSGDRLELFDPQTGEVTIQELFVMAWGASHLIYAEPQDSQKLADWTMGHVRAFEYFGCVPSVVVPDCLRSAVTKVHTFDPELNRTYVEMCRHHNVVAVPARPRKPKDKAKVENAVRIVQQRIIAVLRDRKFHNRQSLEVAVREEVDRINATPMVGYDKKSRKELFEEVDRPAAQPLPQDRWEHQKWLRRRVGIDYCVEFERHWYSVPHKLAGHLVDVRVTVSAVEVYLEQERIAVHTRIHRAGGHSIQEAHMPENHRHALPASLDQILWRAQRIGPSMTEVVHARIEAVANPVAAARACLGLLRLAENAVSIERAERAAIYALEHRLLSCAQFEKILQSGAAEPKETESDAFVKHGNLQGLALWAQGV
ncbi:MAG: IS21 family transposase [Fibrobacterota bacterium]|nr:MAG: IS21 family transposase [Fibrobacterota bacterium]